MSQNLNPRPISNPNRFKVRNLDTDYTPTADDASPWLLRFTAAATFTVPSDADVPFPLGSVINVAQDGSGTVTVAAGAGATVVNAGDLKGGGAVAFVVKVAPNRWYLSGALA